MNGSALRFYFEATKGPISTLGIVPLALGLIVLLVASTLANDDLMGSGCAVMLAMPAGFALLWGGGGLLFTWARHRDRRTRIASAIDDDAAQSILDRGVERIREQALDTLGVDPHDLVSDPLTIVAPVLWAPEGVDEDDLLARIGSDGRQRTAVQVVVVLTLSEHRLGTFRCVYNALTETPHIISTHEVHYRDIDTVSTAEASGILILPSGPHRTTIQELRVVLRSGESIRIMVDAPGLRTLADGQTPPATGVDRSVRTIRAMLQEKKT